MVRLSALGTVTSEATPKVRILIDSTKPMASALMVLQFTNGTISKATTLMVLSRKKVP